jgi:hypothetical protein
MDETLDTFLSSREWFDFRERILARDGDRCSVGRLLGGPCRGVLHVNHIVPRRDRPELALDEDNCGTACASHHVQWEAFARAIRLLRLEELPPCRHAHPYAEGRRQCERRRRDELLAKRVGRLARVAA